MMVDRYLKAVLTAIAGCLAWLCVMGLPERVQAQQKTLDLASLQTVAQPVILVGTGTLHARRPPAHRDRRGQEDRRVGAGPHERGGRAVQEEARPPLTGR